MTTTEKPHRSVSQYNSYYRCPYSYYLGRIAKKWQRPAAWLPQGSAVHEAVEKWEKSGRQMSVEEAQRAFAESYERHVDRYCNDGDNATPNFEYWSRSGPYGGEADLERRFLIGMEQVEKYIRWATSHPEEVVWINEDGTPGIELEFDIDLYGVRVRGFIDQVLPNDCGSEVIVRDLKTGNKPGDDFQLGVYKVALEEQYGVFAPTGDYWMARTGKPTYPYDLSDWTRERVSAAFAELEENIRAERFEPDPEPSKCRFCDVAASCEFRAV